MDNDSSISLTPTAQGSFSKTPLPHVLIHALNEQLSGSFELSTSTGPAGTFLVLDGQPAKARTMVDHYLLQVLAQIGVLTQNQVTNLLPRLLASEELHGRALVRTKLITEEQLELGLRAQLVQQMKTIVDLPVETQWRYYDGVDLLAGWGLESEVRVDPSPFMWASMRLQPPWQHVRPALSRASESALRLKGDAETARFAFEKQERMIVDFLRRKAWRIETLASATGASTETVELVAYCLMLGKLIDFVAASEAALPSGPMHIDLPPVSVDPEPPSSGSVDVIPDSWMTVSGSSSRHAALPPKVEERSTMVPEETIAVAGPKRELPPRRASEVTTLVSETTQKRTQPPPSAGQRPTPIAEVDVADARVTPTAGRGEDTPKPTTGPPPSSDGRRLSTRITPPVMAAATAPLHVATQRPGDQTSGGVPAPRPTTPAPSVHAWSSRTKDPATGVPSTPVPIPADARAESVHPAPMSEFTRPTVAPPPNFEEPSFDILPRPPPYADPKAEVFTRSTVQRMTAVTAEEVAAYIASQDSAKGVPGVQAPAKLPSIPRPPTPAMFGAIPRPPTPSPFAPVPYAPTPAAPSVPSVPRPPTPAMFGVIGAFPPRPVPSPEPPTVPRGAPLLPPHGPQAPSPLRSRADDPPASITDKRPPLADFEATSSRKTIEMSLDQALMEQMVTPPSGRPTVVSPEAPSPAAPRPGAFAPRPAPQAPKAPMAPKPPAQISPSLASPSKPTAATPPTRPSLELELDSPWDDGWDDAPDPFARETLPSAQEPKKK